MKYPIQPKHLATQEEPKGFDVLLRRDQRMLLWAFVQFWQKKGNWGPFTMGQFLEFYDKAGPKEINESVKSGVGFFVESTLKALLEAKGEKDEQTYHATHFMISTYFQWNPAVE